MALPKDNIRLYYKPNESEDKSLKRVYDRYERMKNSTMRHEAEIEWKRGREQWEAMRKERTQDEWQSNHYVPMTFAVVETALSEVIDQSPKPLILPRGAEDAPRAELMSDVFNYTWEIADSDLEAEDIIHDAFTYGTGIGQEYYFRDVRKIKSQDSTEKDATEYEDCYLEAVPLEDYFVDENARGFRGPYGARDCVRRYRMHIDDFKNFFQGKVWDPFGNAKYVKAGGNADYYTYYKPESDVYGDNQVTVLWYWSVRPDDNLIIVANDVVVVAGPNPYKHKQLPFSRAVDIKRTHKFYGKGEAAILESIQDEVNTLRRMIIDRNHLDIDKMFIGSSRINLSDEDTTTRPHGYIQVDDPNMIKAVEYGDIPRSVELSLQHLEDDGTISTGINPRAQALPTTGTATEAAILKESTLKRLRLKVRRLEREFYTRLSRLRVSNILQFYPQPKLEKIVGEVATKNFRDEMAQLEQDGISETDNLMKNGKDLYQKKYKNIRLDNKSVDFKTDGTMFQKPAQGTNFFELRPEYFVPVQGGYDIKFAAGSTLPISEPLTQSKATEMYDRLVQNPGFDPVKLGDLLLKVNHYNPADYHLKQQGQPGQQDDTARIQMAMDLANTENNLIMQGKQVPPTPYAPVLHTKVHVQFTASPPFQQLSKDDPKVQIMLDHITGELAAQQERSQGDPSGQLGPNMASQQPSPDNMQNVMPAQVTGGGQTPPGI